ncbi:MAG: hypothetical protein GXO43_02200 [Crenarchaeota archaeon]|nr:hypothetical protein [Thermoproteota archaeon]
MSTVKMILRWIRRIISFRKIRWPFIEGYLTDIVEVFHEARNLYFEDVLPKLTTKMSYDEVDKILQSEIPANVEVGALLMDDSYYIPSKALFEAVDRTGVQKFLEYRKDVFDCDDFAWAFKAYASEAFLLNSVGFVVGKVRMPNGEEGLHAWNIALVEEHGKTVVYTVEPQTDVYSKGLFTTIDGWEYQPMLIIM